MTAPPFQHSGFFAIRTPLLPLEVMRSWGRLEGAPQAPVPGANGSDAPSVTAEEQIRKRLRGLFEAPDLRDAIFIASPAIEEALRRDGATTDRDKRDRLDASLTKYLMRMAGRCTPFGVFAGVSTGMFASATDMRLRARSSYRRYTRIDMGYLVMLVDGLMKDPRARHFVEYRPNSTLYTTGNRARYVEHRPGKRARSYFLVSAVLDEALQDVLNLAASGVTH